MHIKFDHGFKLITRKYINSGYYNAFIGGSVGNTVALYQEGPGFLWVPRVTPQSKGMHVATHNEITAHVISITLLLCVGVNVCTLLKIKFFGEPNGPKWHCMAYF